MTNRPDDPHDLEGTVDRLEEKVFGRTVDQRRTEDDGTEDDGAADAEDNQDVEPGDSGHPDRGAGAEPS